jgi:hydrogenase-4 component E
MAAVLDTLLIFVLALNFFALGVSRIRPVINVVAVQGIVLGIMPLFLHSGGDFWSIVLAFVIGLGVILLKGWIIPRFLLRAMREANIQYEVTPIIGFMSSLLLGAAGTGLAIAFSYTLPLAEQHANLLIVPASLATAWTGFLLLTTRKKAITQVLGYLLLENGIFLFGLLLLEAMPFLVEMGMLLDLFTGIFVMGIIIHHLTREFASMSTEHLRELKD